MIQRLRPYLIMLSLLCLAQPAQSQEPALQTPLEPMLETSLAEPVKVAPTLKVELILFKNNYFSQSESERIDRNQEPLLSSSSIALPWPDSVSQTASIQPITTNYQRVTDQQTLSLLNQYEALKRSPRYQAVCYLTWIQPDQPAKTIRPIDIAQSEPSCNTRGEVVVHRNRFIHAKLNLLTGKTNTLSTPALLQQSRRIKPNIINYFDHPQIGALLLVSENDKP